MRGPGRRTAKHACNAKVGKITSALTLDPVGPTETAVSYHIDLGVFGKLAALGFPVIKAKARQMATEFASAIRTRLETAT